ncbi:MAG: Maf family protein [Smithellaceae bacterium]|nr:Maf family protein [Smithellaceae bacterium]
MTHIASERLILASASPRRIEMFKQLDLPLEVIPSGVDERGLDGEGPAEHVRRLAANKACEVARDHPDAWVIGADTIVFIDGMILGKPDTPGEARAMLERLSGREHRVFTGYRVMKKAEGREITRVVESSVIFRVIPEDELAWYINSNEPYDKAGGYAVQGRGAFFIREIRGSYTNVMGLPLCEVIDSLKSLGVITFPQGL